MMMEIVFIIIGIGLIVWQRKRAFDRTNEHGVELHNSFFGLIGTSAVDILIAIVGVVCILGGAITLMGF
jgi:hypothetical protein